MSLHPEVAAYYETVITKAAAFTGSFERFDEDQLFEMYGRLHMALQAQIGATRTVDLSLVLKATFVFDRLEDAIEALGLAQNDPHARKVAQWCVGATR